MSILKRIIGIAGSSGRTLSLKALICSLIFLAALAGPGFAQNDPLVIESNGRILINVNGVSLDLAEYLVPVGSIQPFAGGIDKVPAGWALCDGSSVSSADPHYTRLYSVIGTAFGNGSKTGTGQTGSGNFNLPDLRGRFMRGVDMGTGRDPDSGARTTMIDGGGGAPGDAAGSMQMDALQYHVHHYAHPYNPAGYAPYNAGVSFDWGNDAADQTYATTNPATGKTSQNETRPVNIYLNFIIKL